MVMFMLIFDMISSMLFFGFASLTEPVEIFPVTVMSHTAKLAV